MAHRDTLTQEEFSRYRLNPEVTRYIEECRASLGLEKSEMRILDWGCGRGRSVAKLLEAGYDAYGVDIDKDTTTLGREFFNENGYDFDKRISLIDAYGTVEYPDNHFHFVYSLQVLEHVASLETVAAEIHRITRVGGMGLHIFPSRFRPIEGHLFMPLVHWLPKNKLRKLAIYSCTAIGIEPKWQQLQGRPLAEKVECYNDYSVNHTFYRNVNDVSSKFAKLNFNTCFVSLDHYAIQNRPLLKKLQTIRPFAATLNWVVLNFKTVELKTIK